MGGGGRLRARGGDPALGGGEDVPPEEGRPLAGLGQRAGRSCSSRGLLPAAVDERGKDGDAVGVTTRVTP